MRALSFCRGEHKGREVRPGARGEVSMSVETGWREKYVGGGTSPVYGVEWRWRYTHLSGGGRRYICSTWWVGGD